MSLTNTNREARRPARSVGLRDLRFAGTVAAGLIAGFLGIGALSAPLVGWSDWPKKLGDGGNATQAEVRLPPATQRNTVTIHRPSRQGPASLVPVVGLGPAGTLVVTGAAGVPGAAGTPGGTGGPAATGGPG